MLIFGRNVALEYLSSDKKINNIFSAVYSEQIKGNITI